MRHPPDDTGFAAWYEQEAGRLTATVAGVVGDRGRAEEATAEAFARAYARWGRVSAMDSPEGWVVRVAINQVRGRFRRLAVERRHAPAVAGPASVLPPGFPDEALWAAVAGLPERTRTAVVLRYVADLPEAEVARIMGVSRGTVATTLSRARTRLRSRADPRGGVVTEDPLTGLRSPGGGPTPAPVGAVMLRGRRLRARRRVLALGGVAVVALALVGVGLAVATGDDSAESVVAGPATTPGATIPPPDPWAGARWVVHGPDGLVTDAGTQVWEGEPASDGLPTVQRRPGGAIIFHEPGSSWRWSPGAAAPVRRDESVPRESPPPPEVSVRTAANGWTAMGVEPGRVQVLRRRRNELVGRSRRRWTGGTTRSTWSTSTVAA